MEIDMTPTEKIEEFIRVAPAGNAQKELAFWVKVQRENGWNDQTICQKLTDAFKKVAAERGLQ
jgi:hypothetical protein